MAADVRAGAAATQRAMPDDAQAVAAEVVVTDELPDRDEADAVHTRTVWPGSRCVYCGAPTNGRACHAHRDLPRLDYFALVA